VAQSMAYSKTTGANMIISLLIDDGNESRSNRFNLLNPDHVFSGIAAGSHKDKGHQFCLVFAKTYTPNIDDSKVALTDTQYLELSLNVFNEVNKLRKDPKSYAALLGELLPRF